MPGKKQEKDGVWRTVGGRRVFIADGESLSEAMAKSGKFKGKTAKAASPKPPRNDLEESIKQMRKTKQVLERVQKGKEIKRSVDNLNRFKKSLDKATKSKLTPEGLKSLHQHLDKNIQNWKKQGMSKEDALDMLKSEGPSQDDGLWKLKGINMDDDNQESLVRKEYLKYVKENWDKSEDDDYDPRGEVNYWLSKGEFDKASKVIKENGLEDETENFLESMKTPGGRSDFRKYLKRHPISETKKKVEEKDVKQAFKDYWNKKISRDDLQKIKEDSGLGSGRLDSLEYQAAEEDDAEEKNMNVNSQTGRKPITNQKEYETAIEALNYIAKQVNETKDPETKAALEKVMDNYQKDLNEYKRSKRPTSEELKGIKTVKQLHAIADKYGLMPSEIQDMAGLKDRDLFESARQEDEEYKKKFENDVQAAERFLKADEASRPTSKKESRLSDKQKREIENQVDGILEYQMDKKLSGIGATRKEALLNLKEALDNPKSEDGFLQDDALWDIIPQLDNDKDGRVEAEVIQMARKYFNEKYGKEISNIQSQTFKSKKDYDRQIKSLGKVKEDGTFDLTTLKSKNYESGYQVTFSMTDMDMDDESYTKLVEKFKNHDHGNVDAGKFGGSPEISFNVDDIKKAGKLAYKYNQVSIWDWKNNREINTRGTGKWEDYEPETVSQQIKSQRKDKRAKKMDSLRNKLKRK